GTRTANVRRAVAVDSAVFRAFRESLPVRAIVCDGDRRDLADVARAPNMLKTVLSCKVTNDRAKTPRRKEGHLCALASLRDHFEARTIALVTDRNQSMINLIGALDEIHRKSNADCSTIRPGTSRHTTSPEATP